MSVQTIEVMDLLEPSPLDGKIYIDGGYIVFKIRPLYEIPLDWIQNKADLLKWVRHLSGKNWMTADATARFLDLVAKEKGFNLYGE